MESAMPIIKHTACLNNSRTQKTLLTRMLKDETANTNVFVWWKGTYNTHGSHLYLLYGVYKQQNLDTEASAEFLEVVEYFILNMHTARALLDWRSVLSFNCFDQKAATCMWVLQTAGARVALGAHIRSRTDEKKDRLSWYKKNYVQKLLW